MSFDVTATAYDRFMGRFSRPLASVFAYWASPLHGDDALDVGCGPGALTELLVDHLGAEHVAAVDPSPRFVAAARERLPDIDVHLASAEDLPFADDTFDATLSSLVVHFMTDAALGVREMVRVTRGGGLVAACVWDMEGARAPHSVFLRAVREESGAPQRLRPGTRRGDLATLLRAAECVDVDETELTVEASYEDFDEWWDVHTLGVGSSGGALETLDTAAVERVRRSALDVVGPGPITVSATAWAARGRA
ncbi:MAG: methyltransferase domain-containing protein [Microbacterium sp.]